MSERLPKNLRRPLPLTVPAPLPSPEEQAVIAEFDAAPDAPESLRERVALAIFHSVDAAADWNYFSQGFRDDYRRMADAAIAAIAVMRGDQ